MISTVLFVFPVCISAAPAPSTQPAVRHPTVYVTPAEVARARKRIQTDPEAREWFQKLTRSVAPWEAKTPDWVREVIPGEGACFAYGFTGCPICGASWGIWGAARATFDQPGRVTCENNHVLPDEQHPDPGTGWIGPDKRVHYFVGSYNAWVVETLIFKIASPYATIYLLEQDERAGRMAAVILDEIARIYPSCDKGSWDYPSNPPSGRLNRPWYQVARVLVHLVDIYDRIHGHPALDEPSSREGLRRRENIERNLLLNAARYCYDQSKKANRLHNGEADYLRGVLAVGVLLDIPEYVTWPVDGPFGIRAMLANNIDRDGQYFETSSGYALHTRSLYLTFSEPLLNYRGTVFPGGLNLYDDPRFQRFLTLPQMSLVCLGHEAPIGDDAPARSRRTPPYAPARVFDGTFAEYLANRVSDQAGRAEYAALVRHLRAVCPGAERQAKDTAEWRIFHAREEDPLAGAEPGPLAEKWLNGSFFFGQKGLAVLRAGQGGQARAAVLRFGPSLNHGHFDDLNVNYFDRGYEMTYDLGYHLGSTHTQVGWARQTVSHDTVVVDEKSQGGGPSGGSLHHFADLPGLVLAEASSTVYENAGVHLYRRCFALAEGYALDVFRVQGGRQHDLPMHSLTTTVEFEGVKFTPPRPGSLAGEQYNWGDAQLNDGDMKGYPNKPYWNPPPGNGYGFLSRPAFARPEGNWSATWRLEGADHPRFQVIALQDGGTEVISASAPGLYPHFPKAGYVVRRRSGENLSSCFVSLWQTSTDQSPFAARALNWIGDNVARTANTALALGIDLGGNRRDFWLIGMGPEDTVSGGSDGVAVALRGALAHGRWDGDGLLAAYLLDGTEFQIGGWTIRLASAGRQAVVKELPDGSPAIRMSEEWPADGRYDQSPVYISNPAYSRNSAYVLCSLEKNVARLEQADTLLGSGVVQEIPDEHTLISRIPHEYACGLKRGASSGFFKGKLLASNDGRAGTRIRKAVLGDALRLEVDSTKGFQAGQAFRYHDVQPGDTIGVQHYAHLERLAPGRYRLRANADVTLSAPNASRINYLDRDGNLHQSRGGLIPCDASAAGEGIVLTLQ